MTIRKGILPLVTTEICSVADLDSEDVLDSLKHISSYDRFLADSIENCCSSLGRYTGPLNTGISLYFLLLYSGSVPQLTNKTSKLLDLELVDVSPADFVSDLVTRLSEDNPVLYDCLMDLSFEKQYAGSYVYRLLELQREIDFKVNPKIGLGQLVFPETHYLREELNIALNTENYETAASLRDAINSNPQEFLQHWENIPNSELFVELERKYSSRVNFCGAKHPETWALRKKFAYSLITENFEEANILEKQIVSYENSFADEKFKNLLFRSNLDF